MGVAFPKLLLSFPSNSSTDRSFPANHSSTSPAVSVFVATGVRAVTVIFAAGIVAMWFAVSVAAGVRAVRLKAAGPINA